MAGAGPLAPPPAEPEGHQRTLIAVFGPLTGRAFIGTGIFAWLRRPENRVGGLMVAVGFAACLGASGLDRAVGLHHRTAVHRPPLRVLYHLLVAFPIGTIASRAERLVGVGYLSAIVVHPVQVLFQDTGLQGRPPTRC